jgi:hypothetical protein
VNIEFIERGAEQCPFIRIFGRDVEAIETLRDSARGLAAGALNDVAIHALPRYQSVGAVTFVARVSERDIGITRHQLSHSFEWSLSGDGWTLVKGLIDGLLPLKPRDAYQWLAGGEARYGLEESEIGLLLSASHSGAW